MNRQEIYQEAADVAQSIREDIIAGEYEAGDLQGTIYDRCAEEADRLCIYTYDIRCVVRMLEDAGIVDDYMELVDPSASRDEQNAAIAYSFWQITIYDEVKI